MEGLMQRDTSMEAMPAVAPTGPLDRKLTVQEVSNAMAGPVAAAAGITRISTPLSMSVVDLIMLDHNCVRAMYDAYRSPCVNLEQKQLLAWEIIMAVSAHSAKEELVVYPVVRSTLGDSMADQAAAEHQQVKNLLATLDTLGADKSQFDMQLRAGLDSVVAHMQEEEATLLPQLAAVLDAESQLRLGILFEAAKVRAPTRPHPEMATTALPAPFFENQLAATKLVDASLDQARMPALAPTAVGLSPLASAAVISSAVDGGGLMADGAGGIGGGGSGGGLLGPLLPQSEGLPAAMGQDGQLAGEGLPAADGGGDGGEDESMAGQGGGVLGASFMGMGGTAPTGVVLGGGVSVEELPPAKPTPALTAGQGEEGTDGAAAAAGGGVGGGVGGGTEGLEGLLADDAGPLGAGVDAEVVPYPSGFVGNLVPASLAGAAAVVDYTDVGVGGVAGVPADSDGGDSEMGAAGGMPGDLTAVVNAPLGPPDAAGGGDDAGGGGGGFGSAGVMGVAPRAVKPSGGDFANDIAGTDVEAVQDV